MVPGEGMLVIEVKSQEHISVDDDGWRLGCGEPPPRSSAACRRTPPTARRAGHRGGQADAGADREAGAGDRREPRPNPPVEERAAEGGTRHETPAAAVTRLEAITQRLAAPATMSLHNDVRQSRALAKLIELLLGGEFYIGFDREDEEDDEPPLTVLGYRTEAEQQEQFASTLMALWDDGWDPRVSRTQRRSGRDPLCYRP